MLQDTIMTMILSDLDLSNQINPQFRRDRETTPLIIPMVPLSGLIQLLHLLSHDWSTDVRLFLKSVLSSVVLIPCEWHLALLIPECTKSLDIEWVTFIRTFPQFRRRIVSVPERPVYIHSDLVHSQPSSNARRISCDYSPHLHGLFAQRLLIVFTISADGSWALCGLFPRSSLSACAIFVGSSRDPSRVLTWCPGMPSNSPVVPRLGGANIDNRSRESEKPSTPALIWKPRFMMCRWGDRNPGQRHCDNKTQRENCHWHFSKLGDRKSRLLKYTFRCLST